METAGYRQQKATQQQEAAEPEAAAPFLDFSEEAAAAARAAAAQVFLFWMCTSRDKDRGDMAHAVCSWVAAWSAAGQCGHAQEARRPAAPPAVQETPREKALKAIEGIQQQVSDLEQQVAWPPCLRLCMRPPTMCIECTTGKGSLA